MDMKNTPLTPPEGRNSQIKKSGDNSLLEEGARRAGGVRNPPQIISVKANKLTS